MKKLTFTLFALLLLIANTVAAKSPDENKAAMKNFEIMINTQDKKLADKLSRELIDDKAAFFTPVSPDPLYGGEGYLSVVYLMRTGFSDVNWKLDDMVAEKNTVAVRWTISGTHDGEFMGLKPTGKKFSCTVMNFYYFNDAGKIVNDIAADGMIGILRPLGLVR